MIEVRFHERVDDALLRFVVIAARTRDGWLLRKRRSRDSIEFPTGGRAPGEPIDSAARRALFEEAGITGASPFPLRPFSVRGDDGATVCGMLCAADIASFDPASSGGKDVLISDSLPSGKNGSEITASLMKEAMYRAFTRFAEPAVNDLGFRRRLMADPDTMRYNHAWGGVIPFPPQRWAAWHERWIGKPEGRRFYRYVIDAQTREPVGEAAFHMDEERCIWLADVIVLAKYRGRGYGQAALRLLCDAARDFGVDVLRDEIAIDNPAIRLFLRQGFVEESRSDQSIMVKKELRNEETEECP